MRKMPPEKVLFSTATQTERTRRMRHMRSSIFSTLLVVFAFPSTCLSADQPLDFNYRVSGAAEIRPLLVFNDGTDTFIQPSDPTEKSVLVNGVRPIRQGAYFIVRGVAQTVTLSQGKESVQIAYARPLPVLTDSNQLRASEQEQPEPAMREKRVERVPDAKVPERTERAPTRAVRDASNTADTPACKPVTERHEAAFVVSFRGESAKITRTVRSELEKTLNKASAVTSASVHGEASDRGLAKKRADAIKNVLVQSGVSEDLIQVDVREPRGIGSEVHIYRTVEIPCGASIAMVPSRKGNATIIWDRDARELIERIGGELKMKSSVQGSEKNIPVRLGIVDQPFEEAMAAVGRALGDDADVILRRDELVLRYKEK